MPDRSFEDSVTSSGKTPFAFLPEEAEVVSAIREQGSLSRTDLAHITGYSRTKITSVVGRLIETGILKEVGIGDSQGGRRPRLLNFNGGLGYVAGLDMGVTSLDLALADLNGRILEHHSEPADVCDGPEPVLSRVCAMLTEIMTRWNVSPEQLLALGIGVPGPVDRVTELLVAPANMPNWEGYPIQDFVHQTFPTTRVVVDNDANVMALGELKAGAGRGVESFVYVKIGTGIGAGVVSDGKVSLGSTGCAGDVGHICVDRNGPLCQCGNTGCLQALASGPAIAARATEAALSGKSAILAEYLEARGGTLTAKEVGEAATAGDPVSNEIIQDSGRLIGETLAGVVNFFNPNLILLGGGVSSIGPRLLSSIRQAVLHRSHPLSTRKLRIDYAALGSKAGVTGAVLLALDSLFVFEG